MVYRNREQAHSYNGIVRILKTKTPALGRGFFASLQPYTSAAIAALKVLLGRMALLISSALAW